jgi:hypothetical protein
MNMLEMKNTSYYINDSFGLKTLDEGNKIISHLIENMEHNSYLSDYEFFKNNVLKYLT